MSGWYPMGNRSGILCEEKGKRSQRGSGPQSRKKQREAWGRRNSERIKIKSRFRDENRACGAKTPAHQNPPLAAVILPGAVPATPNQIRSTSSLKRRANYQPQGALAEANARIKYCNLASVLFTLE